MVLEQTELRWAMTWFSDCFSQVIVCRSKQIQTWYAICAPGGLHHDNTKHLFGSRERNCVVRRLRNLTRLVLRATGTETSIENCNFCRVPFVRGQSVIFDEHCCHWWLWWAHCCELYFPWCSWQRIMDLCFCLLLLQAMPSRQNRSGN